MARSFKTGVSVEGDLTTSGKLKVTEAAANEGGQIELSAPSSGSTINTNVTIDVYQNKLRFFEAGGTNRGYYVDITAGGASVGTSLTGGSTGAMNYDQQQSTKQSGISASGVTIVSKSFTTNGYPVQVMVTGDAENSTAGAWVKLQLYRDSTAIGKIIHVEMSAASENVPYALTVIDAPSAGTYTYSLKTASTVATGTMNFGETDGPVLTLIELSGPKGDTGATFTGGTLTSALTLRSGSTASGTSPLYFGTSAPGLLTTPVAGALEFDLAAPYFTVSTNYGRGVIPSMNFFSLGSNRNITDGTSNSSIFGKSLTVEGGRTYYFKVVVGGTKGTTNAFVRFLMTGTATLSAVGYIGFATNGAAPDTAGGRFTTTASAANITAASTGTQWSYAIEGKFSVASGLGGTWIPTCNFSATTGTTPTVTAGSYVYIYPISNVTSGDITIGAWA